MTVPIRQNLVSSSMYSIKAPYTMTPQFITVHNTANDASANNEIAYMISNNNQVSFHFAVDDNEIVQGLPLDRNGWHSGDGANGSGNRLSIAVEICYSKSGGSRFTKAEQNAAWLVAKLMRDHNISLANVRTHQMWNGKYCPHRTLDLGWQRFLNLVETQFNTLTGSSSASSGSNSSSASNSNTTTISLVDWMKANNMDSSFDNRATLAAANGISNYTGTAAQNTQLLNILSNQSTASTSQNYFPKVASSETSIVNALNSIGVDSSFAYRTSVATANGISNYTGTAAQNTQLLNLLKQGLLIRP